MEALTKPLPVWSPKAWYYGAARSFMNSAGRLSDGIALGYRYGFDSGVMLEYVYQNKANGKFGIGKLIDRMYLNAPGWRGIRNRGRLLSNTLANTIEEKAADLDRPLRIVDLACGGGRYVLEALKATETCDIQAILRDYRQENVDSAASLAQDLGLNVTTQRADAFSDFDLEDIAAWQPDIVIVSGLHEIFEDDELIEVHFRQVSALLQNGGTLLQTIQPTHPQLEFIARVLPAHTGKLWAMRLRPWELTREWARKAGLQIRTKIMENENIFGVVRFEKE
jgi:SAM-dependent methyltransferase